MTGLKKIKGIQDPALLQEIAGIETKRLEPIKEKLDKATVDGPSLPAGTPNRHQAHQQMLQKYRKRVRYKEKLISAAEERAGALQKKAEEEAKKAEEGA